MRLFQYYEEEKVRLGVLRGKQHMAVAKEWKLKDLLDKDEKALEELLVGESLLPLEETAIKFAPVVTNPDKILCIGLNYREHIDETGLNKGDKPGFPPVFPKFPNSLLGHRQELQLPKQAKNFDYEAELVLVIGRDCKEVAAEEAMEYIAGFAVGNDFSARDMQFATSQWLIGKSCDGFAPVGPYFVSKNEVEVDNLRITCKVNGELVQDSNTSHMIYSCQDIVSYLSNFMTLKKGDLIYTGTPSGVVLGKKTEDQVWLKAGDAVCTEIEGLGRLEFSLI